MDIVRIVNTTYGILCAGAGIAVAAVAVSMKDTVICGIASDILSALTVKGWVTASTYAAFTAATLENTAKVALILKFSAVYFALGFVVVGALLLMRRYG